MSPSVVSHRLPQYRPPCATGQSRKGAPAPLGGNAKFLVSNVGGTENARNSGPTTYERVQIKALPCSLHLCRLRCHDPRHWSLGMRRRWQFWRGEPSTRHNDYVGERHLQSRKRTDGPDKSVLGRCCRNGQLQFCGHLVGNKWIDYLCGRICALSYGGGDHYGNLLAGHLEIRQHNHHCDRTLSHYFCLGVVQSRDRSGWPDQPVHCVSFGNRQFQFRRVLVSRFRHYHVIWHLYSAGRCPILRNRNSESNLDPRLIEIGYGSRFNCVFGRINRFPSHHGHS